MRDIKNKLTSSKNTKNIQNRKGKSFGYQVLGFGAGGVPPNPFIIATGGTITTVDTNYKVHTFTGPGTFAVTCGGTADGSNGVDYLVIAGGGGGGGPNCAGGGGTGGYRESVPSPAAWTGSPVAAPGGARTVCSGTNYPISIGAGGAGSPAAGNPGADSIFTDRTSAGGGRGAGYGPLAGGSGGGGSPGNPGGGTGNTPPVSPAQGTNGAPNSGPNRGGGGGGSGAAGSGVTGGAGTTTSINGSPVQRGGGGGGGGYLGQPGGSGGAGGGGPGGPVGNPSGSGTANTGSGGGGAAGLAGPGSVSQGAGGSGLVILRYKFQ